MLDQLFNKNGKPNAPSAATDVDAQVPLLERLRVLEGRSGIRWRLPPSPEEIAKADAKKEQAKAYLAARARVRDRLRRAQPLHAEIRRLTDSTLVRAGNERDDEAGEQAIERLRRALAVLAGRG